MTNHLKRIAAPKTWVLNRKGPTFTMHPNPGAHALGSGLALGMILRDHLKLASTMGEIRKIILGNDLLVDGKKQKDYRYNVGLFDVISIPHLKKHYRISLDNKGRLVVLEIPASESSTKICKVVGKKVLAGGKIQLNLHDGKNSSSQIKAKVGDSLVLNLPDFQIKEVLDLQRGAAIFLIKGKHSGDLGVLESINKKEAQYQSDGKKVETAKRYIFVVGKQKPLIKIN